MIDVMDKKGEIIEFIREVGPTLPVRIAKTIEMEPLFVSAILNEMVKDGQVKISNMKRGASGFYFLPGQEEKLCQFAEEELGGDKQAYRLLKEKKYLKDSEQSPQIRVSLRKIKDFAISFNYEGELYWKFMFVPDEEIERILEENKGKISEEHPQKGSSLDEKNAITINVPENEKSEIKSKKEIKKEESEKKIERIFDEDKSKEFLDVEDNEKSEILIEVENYLQKKGKHLNILEFNKNEVVGVTGVKTDVGNVSFLVIAKSKKTFSDADVLLVNDRASREKMPLYLLLKGKLTKKAEKLLEDYQNLIIIEKF